MPVFVLTHHPRPPLEMGGGTVFHFVTEGMEAALHKARAAAQGKDVRIGGGAATIRARAAAQHIDLPALGYRVTEHVSTPAAMHLVMER